MTINYGDVPLLDPDTGRFPDEFAPQSVATDATTAAASASTAQASRDAAGASRDAASASAASAAGSATSAERDADAAADSASTAAASAFAASEQAGIATVATAAASAAAADAEAQAAGSKYPLVNLITNGSFEVDSNADGVPDGLSAPLSGTSYSLSTDARWGARSLKLEFIDAVRRGDVVYSAAQGRVAGHVYYAAVWGKSSIPDTRWGIYDGTKWETSAIPQDWRLCSIILQPTTSGAASHMHAVTRRGDALHAVGDHVLLDGATLIDLTDCFGAGFEPSQQEMDAIMQRLGPFDGTASAPQTVTGSLASVREGAATAERQDRRAAGVIRVATWNCTATTMRWQVPVILGGIDPDVFAGQEVFESSPDTGDPRKSFAAIFGRHPLVHVRFDTTWVKPLPTWDKGRGITSAFPLIEGSWSPTPSQGVQRVVLLAHGRRIAFYNIHLPWATSRPLISGYMEALWAVVSADPEELVIVAGDFNTPDVQDVEDGVGDWFAFTPFFDAGWTMAQGTGGVYATTHDDPEEVGYIDNIVCSPGLEILGWGVEEPYSASDHRPVWADIAFTAAGSLSSSLVAAKGDLLVGAAQGDVARLPVSATEGDTLIVDPAAPAGLRWARPSGGVRTGLWLPGVSGNHVSAPSAPALGIAGDLDLRIKAARESWAAGSAALLDKQGSAPTFAWLFYCGVGQLYFRYSRDGGGSQEAVVGRTISPDTDTQALWLRVTVDVDNGADGHTITMFKSVDGELWTQLGTPQVRAGAIELATNAEPVTIGSRAGTNDRFRGTVHEAQIRDGIDGAVVAAWDGSWPHTRQRDPLGNIWTVAGTASGWQAV